jgi:hypothetical protein
MLDLNTQGVLLFSEKLSDRKGAGSIKQFAHSLKFRASNRMVEDS